MFLFFFSGQVRGVLISFFDSIVQKVFISFLENHGVRELEIKPLTNGT